MLSQYPHFACQAPVVEPKEIRALLESSEKETSAPLWVVKLSPGNKEPGVKPGSLSYAPRLS